MRYVSSDVPTDPATAPVVVARRAVHDLHDEAERRGWAICAFQYAPGARGGSGVGGHGDDRLVSLLAQLRAVTTRYVCALRADGARPEQMLVQVKAFLREAMAAERWPDPDAKQALKAAVVRWSIDTYYDR